MNSSWSWGAKCLIQFLTGGVKMSTLEEVLSAWKIQCFCRMIVESSKWVAGMWNEKSVQCVGEADLWHDTACWWIMNFFSGAVSSEKSTFCPTTPTNISFINTEESNIKHKVPEVLTAVCYKHVEDCVLLWGEQNGTFGPISKTLKWKKN